MVLSESLDMFVLDREDCLRFGAIRLSRERPMEFMLFVEDPLMGCCGLVRFAAARFSTDCVERRVFGSR